MICRCISQTEDIATEKQVPIRASHRNYIVIGGITNSHRNIAVLYHTRILYHTRMVRTIRVYAYGTAIRVWYGLLYHTRMVKS